MKTVFVLLSALILFAVSSVPASAHDKAPPGNHWVLNAQTVTASAIEIQYSPALAEVEVRAPLIDNKMLVLEKTAYVSITPDKIFYERLRPPSGNKVFV